MSLTLRRAREAATRIAGIATTLTPLKESQSLSQRLGRPVSLKLETTQATGAFKLRGAASAIMALSPDERRNGVVTASSGNHGRAVAYVARQLGIPAVICLSDLVVQAKIDNIAAFGAELSIGGKDQDVAMERAHDIAEKRAMTFISPFDNLGVISGQATVGLEIMEQNPDVDTIIVPVSGGGLLGGVAYVAKKMNPGVRVIGVSMERGAAMYHSLQAGTPVIVEELPTIADALQGGIGLDNRYSFDLCAAHADAVVTIDEDQIRSGIRHGFYHERLVLEGSGACGIGLLLSDRAKDLGDNIVVICTGDNIDPDLFLDIIAGQPAAKTH